ncbi:permease prefix domain 1-containing protein [Clostridium hydrogeniformans]|uniref:permease prefix domain 1-containing protein n=1 Tax=Clostridium hydrogeniformans TaxID=349933 RepID=UPI000483C9E7|nr:permease prefix domain 1-containing protein [Clostridium hydrogeniformans]
MGKEYIISNKGIKEVKDYVDKLTYKLDESSKAVVDFKEEILFNLTMSINDLIEIGYKEEDAISTAIDRFGETEVLKEEINRLYKRKKNVGKNILLMALISLSISVLLITIGIIHDRGSFKFYKTVDKAIRASELTLENPITEELKEEVNNIVNSNIHVKGAAIYNSKVERYENGVMSFGGFEPFRKGIEFDYNYIYPLNEETKDSRYFKDNLGIVFDEITNHYSNQIEDSDQVIDIIFREKKFTIKYYMLCAILFIVFWCLFGVWAAVNIFYEERNKAWIISVFFTNVIGYGIYKIYYKDKKELTFN